MFDLTRTDERDTELAIRNLVPAPFLKPRFEFAHSTTLFSATLSPWHYFADLLGMPEDTAWIDVDSPFVASQLKVEVARGISTRYQHRKASLVPIADLMEKQYAEIPGNYLAFFSSFDYLEQAADTLAQRHPAIPIWRQSRRMSEAERSAFLERFTSESKGIGFAVLGGAFGEGIDLPGARLIGAFVATLGLPQVNPVNEQLRERLQAMFGAGYDYAYLYPGLQKVVQAAGRVIRTESDQGTVWLIDDRFARPEVLDLLPAWWHVAARGRASA
jgi:Rad3-related DNA helicase